MGTRLSCGIPLLAGVVAIALGVSALPGAAVPDETAIEEAREAEAVAQDAVAGAETRLAALSAELDRSHVAAAKAVEEHNGVRIALAEAIEIETATLKHASAAADRAAEARVVLSRVAAASYRHGGELAHVGMLFRAADGQALLDAAAVFRSVTGSQAGAFQQASDATREADRAAADAAAARAERQHAEWRAEQARQKATRLVADQEEAVAAAEFERGQLLEELAAARGTTITLEEARQKAIADEEAAERERVAREQPSEQAREPEEPPAVTPTRSPTVEPTEPPRGTSSPSATPSSPPSTSPPTSTPSAPPSPTPTSTPSSSPSPTGPPNPPAGAEAAVAYAYQQVGKPYEWGGSGPDSFDCSGLTMRAWQAGGRVLPHWSVAQAERVIRIPYSQMRPGDLVFWSDDGQSSGVYHVGLYIGEGQMIHAPRPGKAVEVQSVFYWHDPAFYGRVS